MAQDFSTMKSRLKIEQEIMQMNGASFYDHQVMARLLLDIRDLLFEMNENLKVFTGSNVKVEPNSSDLRPKKNAKGAAADEAKDEEENLI